MSECEQIRGQLYTQNSNEKDEAEFYYQFASTPLLLNTLLFLFRFEQLDVIILVVEWAMKSTLTFYYHVDQQSNRNKVSDVHVCGSGGYN